MKTCSKCQRVLDRSRFHRDKTGRDGLRANCKDCARRWRDATRDARRKYDAEYHAGSYSPEKQRAGRLRRYGLTEESLAELQASQGGLCAVCRRAPSRRGLVIDHDHQTKAIRGLLCDPCNTGIGLLGDTLEGLQRAVEYFARAEQREPDAKAQR